jgi:hypothetical protein
MRQYANTDAALPQFANTLPVVYEFGPHGTQFAQDVKLSFVYDPTQLPPGSSLPNMQVGLLVDGDYMILPNCTGLQPATPGPCVTSRTTLSPTRNKIEVATRHFSTYALISGGPVGGVVDIVSTEDSGSRGPWPTAVLLAGFGGLLIGVGFWLVRRRWLTPSNDAARG